MILFSFLFFLLSSFFLFLFFLLLFCSSFLSLTRERETREREIARERERESELERERRDRDTAREEGPRPNFWWSWLVQSMETRKTDKGEGPELEPIKPERNLILRRDPEVRFWPVPVTISSHFLVGRLRWNMEHDFRRPEFVFRRNQR
jgi:hypothetical protein